MNGLTITLLILGPTLILLIVMAVVLRVTRSEDQEEEAEILPKGEVRTPAPSKQQEKPAPILPKIEGKPQKAPAPELDYCPFCGTPVSPGSYFCSDCGQAFENN